MVSSDQVYLGEDSGTVERSWEVLDVGNGVAVGNTCIVQCPIVATDAPVTAPLRHLM